jgi:hypothetical protein
VNDHSDEYSGGTIINKCPTCGQFCATPTHYKPAFEDGHHVGSFADGYCKRCKTAVKLEVEYIWPGDGNTSNDKQRERSGDSD